MGKKVLPRVTWNEQDTVPISSYLGLVVIKIIIVFECSPLLD